MIKFTEHNHLYESIVPDGRKWQSITSIIARLKEPFNKEQKAASCSVRKPSQRYPNKWYGLSKEEILAAWEGEGKRSIELGHWYHSAKEQEICMMEGKVYKPVYENGVKIAPPQRLQEGIYPEHLVYLESAGICGQSDLVEVSTVLDITDHKTSKEIRRKAFETWEGPKHMLHPVENLEDCEFYHYALQLSLYAYIILRHNPILKMGKLTIEHVKFEQEKEDKYGYPIYRKDSNGGYVIKDIERIELPYLRSEVTNILNWLREQQ